MNTLVQADDQRPLKGPVNVMASVLVALSVCLGVSGCGRGEPSAQGNAASSSEGRATGTATPGSAPDAQPQYNQVGNGTSSRVVTNAAGQRGLSVRELPQPDAAPNTPQGNSDEALGHRVRVALSIGTTGTTGTYSDDMLVKLDVTATNGIVTLRGPVGSERARQLFAERAKDVDGVRGVNNLLHVEAGAPEVPGRPGGRGWERAPSSR